MSEVWLPLDLEGMDSGSETCAATTKAGRRCLLPRGPSGFCGRHDPAAERMPEAPTVTTTQKAPRARLTSASAGGVELEGVAYAFTDGACSPNPGPGGWGALIRIDGVERELSGGDPATTNNRMELLGAISALEALPAGSEVVISTDSQYVMRGITEWIAGWKRKGWKLGSGEPVKNSDLWRRLEAVVAERNVTWAWVKGHAGHPENERADRLASGAIPGRPPASAGAGQPRPPQQSRPTKQSRPTQQNSAGKGFPARYPGSCPVCKGRYEPGDSIARHAGNGSTGYIHLACKA